MTKNRYTVCLIMLTAAMLLPSVKICASENTSLAETALLENTAACEVASAEITTAAEYAGTAESTSQGSNPSAEMEIQGMTENEKMTDNGAAGDNEVSDNTVNTEETENTEDTEETEDIEETEETEESDVPEGYMSCTNTEGGRAFGTAGDTTRLIGLDEDVTGSSGIKGSEVIAYAFLYVGNPYVWSGTSLTDGCDCSGYVMTVLAHFGITVPHPSSEMANYGIPVEKEDARLGDVIIYNGGSHVAFYMGDDLILEAEGSEYGIVAGNRNAFEDWDGSEKDYVIRRMI